MKRMKHPEHGFHYAYNNAEEQTMRNNGWVDDDPAEVQKVEEPDEPRQKRPYNRKVS
jgi:hypothetical protein